MVVLLNTIEVLTTPWPSQPFAAETANVDRVHDEDVWPYSIPQKLQAPVRSCIAPGRVAPWLQCHASSLLGLNNELVSRVVDHDRSEDLLPTGPRHWFHP